MGFEAGDLVLHYDPQLKPVEGNKFHRQCEGPYEIVERVADVMYCVKKIRGHYSKSQVVHFNTLRLYRRRQEGSMEREGAREAADAPKGGSGAGQQVQATLDGVVSMEPDTAEKVVWVADSALGREVQQGAGSDDVVDIPAEGGGLFENVQSSDKNGGESSKDEPEVKEE